MEGFVAERFEDFGHATFEMKSAVEDDVGGLNFLEIVGGGFVEVGVDAGPHEGLDFAFIAAKVDGEIGEHSGGGNDLDFCVGVGGLSRVAGSEDSE